MPKKTKDIEKALKKKGFTEEINRSHNMYILYMNGKKTHINTHTSQGATHKEISDNLAGVMAKQMKITNKQFDDFVICTLSEIEYKSILIEKKELEA